MDLQPWLLARTTLHEVSHPQESSEPYQGLPCLYQPEEKKSLAKGTLREPFLPPYLLALWKDTVPWLWSHQDSMPARGPLPQGNVSAVNEGKWLLEREINKWLLHTTIFFFYINLLVIITSMRRQQTLMNKIRNPLDYYLPVFFKPLLSHITTF